jgi:hypothetical protein
MATDASNAEATMPGHSTTPPSTPQPDKTTSTYQAPATDGRYEGYEEDFTTSNKRLDSPSTPSWDLQRRPTPHWEPGMSIFKSPSHESMSLGVGWGENGLPQGIHAEMLLHPGFLEWRQAQPHPRSALSIAERDIKRLAHERRALSQLGAEVQGSRYLSASRPVFLSPPSSPAQGAEEVSRAPPRPTIAELEAGVQRCREEGERLEAELRSRRLAEETEAKEKRA